VSEADLCRSRDMGDVTKREQEVRERKEDTSKVPILDDVPDQPSSPLQTASKESQPIQDDRQEVLGDGSVSTGRNTDREAPSSAEISDRERSTMEENIRVHTSLDTDELANLLDETIPTLQSATIDCSSGNTTDWPIEQAADKPDVQSLQEMRKPYRFTRGMSRGMPSALSQVYAIVKPRLKKSGLDASDAKNYRPCSLESHLHVEGS